MPRPCLPPAMQAYDRIVADADLDGLCAAAVLKQALPEATVRFAHPALVRSGHLDDIIDRRTVMVDLPFHPACGWYVDHHHTNRPNDDEASAFLEAGGRLDWQDAPSAARVAYDLMSPLHPMPHLEAVMPFVDALDSGGIERAVFLEDGPLVRLSRCLGLLNEPFMHHVLDLLVSGETIEALLNDPWVADTVAAARQDRAHALAMVKAHTTVIDGLAVCRLDGKDGRVSGYLVTAHVGSAADACCIIHGHVDGAIDRADRPALSASFYANSFHSSRRRVDLSRLATLLDPNGGGHANACGCRVQPLGSDGERQDREVEAEDVDRNLSAWLRLWRSLHAGAPHSSS
jgi:hypothetical protein